jgi:predicted RNA polymerase sigma factor
VAPSGRPHRRLANLAAYHAWAGKAEESDWKRVAVLYDALRQVMHSPVVDLNGAVALNMAFGPEIGLVLLGEID